MMPTRALWQRLRRAKRSALPGGVGGGRPQGPSLSRFERKSEGMEECNETLAIRGALPDRERGMCG